MPRRKLAVIPAAPRMTLSEWIELDDDDTSHIAQPACSNQDGALHARILIDPGQGKNDAFEPLQPPSGLRLPPLG